MKRLLLLLSVLYVALTATASLTLNDRPYVIDTIQQFPAGPGAMFYQLSMNPKNASGHLDCWLMTVDTKNPYVSIEQVLGGDAVIGTERPSAMAVRKTTDTRVFYGGSNGDFFQTTGDIGRPTGLTIVNNEFAYTPSSSTRRLGAVDEQMRGVIASNMDFKARLVLSDTTLTIKHVNYKREENQLVLYNQHNGASTYTNAYGTELLVELLPGEEWHTNCHVRAKVTNKEVGVGSMTIPAGNAVLSGHGTMQTELNRLEVGDTVIINLSLSLDGVTQNVAQCIGGDNYALIVDNGQVEQSNFWNELHPRTAFGQSLSGDTLLFLVVDGRGSSIGCTTKVLGEIIRYYGAWKAVNWDGGGSSCLYIRPFGETNHGSDNSERAVGNAMFAVANVPDADTTIVAIHPYRLSYALPRYGVLAPRFLGYNRYGVLVSTDVQGVTLNAPDEVGTVLPDGRFLASGSNGGVITATRGAATTTLQLRLVTQAVASFRLDTVLVDTYKPYSVEVSCFISPDTIQLFADALTWTSSDESVCTVDQAGTIRAVDNGEAFVIGTLGNLSDTIVVRVQNPTDRVMVWDDMVSTLPSWKLKSSSGFNLTMETEEVEGVTEAVLHYTYSVVRGANLNLYRHEAFYGLPDSISFGLVLDDTQVSRLLFAATPVNAVTPVSFSANNLPAGQEYWCTFAVSEVADIADRGIYPLYSGNINLLLDATTPVGSHAIYLKGIRLIYDGVPAPTGLKESTMGENTVVKRIENGRIVIIRGEDKYSVLGLKL